VGWRLGMLIRLKFRFSEVFFGMLLAVAIFAMGAVFSSHRGETNQAVARSGSIPVDDIIFGYPAIDVFTAVLALATIGLMIATIVLGIITARGIRNQTLDTRILQRAYISAEPGGVSPFLPRDLAAPPTNQTFVGHAGFRNAGRLPARNVQWYMDAEYATNPNYEPVRFGELTGKNVISPGEAMTQGSIERDIAERVGYFFVWGKIVYDDGFGEERETIFCHRYNCRRLERGTNGGFFRIRSRYGRHHDKGNDAS
jgi:hypothetical protein